MDVTGLGSLAEFATTVVDKFFPDADAKRKDEAAKELLEMTQEFNLVSAQLDVNKEEAKNANWFVSGWRPFCGWIGGGALLYSTILEPFMRFIASVVFNYTNPFPTLDTSITFQILFGMLGLGAMRTYEKKQGVHSK